ncbi:PREDICTED: pectinesterase-like [Ipomoea nil]|uniref:pectinesterase-like n=1 Tax=Ipomoea nil TaxID=35883 RepID=UPI000900D02A|nr:PREDICTED: pectinesterase-like [Ipomoea nil]
MGDGDKNKKVAIAGVASILLVACVVAATISVTNMGGSSEVTTSTKEVEAICAPTDYKETCKTSLSGAAAKTNDPKELIKTAFHVTMKNISHAISRSALLKEAAKDPRASDALDLCKTLLNNSIGDLEKSCEAAGDFDVNNILEYANDLKVWLSGAITQQETCRDAFENTTGDTGEKMKHLLKTAGELTSNGLAIITNLTEAASTLEAKKRRRLLSDNDGFNFPAFIDATARRLLNANAGSIKPNVVVAKDGSGEFKSINDAINKAPPNNDAPYVIKIKAGVYNEYVVVPKNMNHVVFIGDGPTKTKITENKNKVDGIGTYQTATVAIEGEHFTARDIGFENSAGAQKHQAVALRVSADHAIFSNCAIDGYQDTLYAHAYRQYYRDCSISGTIDFIFGDASAVFQNCKMIVRKPLATQECMVTAQGRMEHRGVGGIVLQNCEICPAPQLKTVQPPARVFLGRPWKQYARTLIAESFIDGFIAPEGWSPWKGNFALDTLWYAEYQNRGPGSDTSKRVNWKGYLKNISPQEVSKYSAGQYIQADQWIKPTGIPYDSA